MMLLKRTLALVLSCALIVVTSGCASIAAPEVQATAPSEIQPAQMTPEHLQQLVAPIALYPDELVAQILAASTYPTEIVEAERWLQQNSSLKGAQLADAVDKQPWDPSVKALAQFPSVLANMDKNLSWTSALGDAYFNDEQAVLDAVQVMRKRAQNAGTLKSTPQQTVTTQGQTIIIQPANPEIVYVPQYDPWIVYGAPLAVYPGFIAGPWVAAPFIGFGIGFGIGWGFGWGWHRWGLNWRDRHVVFNHNTFVSRSRTVIHRSIREGHHFTGHENHFDHRGDRGFAAPHAGSATHSGAFHGFEHGGVAQQPLLPWPVQLRRYARRICGRDAWRVRRWVPRRWVPRRRRPQVIGFYGGNQFLSKKTRNGGQHDAADKRKLTASSLAQCS